MRPLVLGALLALAPLPAAGSAADLWVAARRSFEQGLYPAATETLRALLRDYPSDALADDADYLLALCRVYTGSFEQAARDLEQYGRRHPGSPYARFVGYWLGYSRYHLGQTREAVAAFRSQVDTYPAETRYRQEALSYLGELYEKSGSVDLALAVSMDLVAGGAEGELVAHALYRMGTLLLTRGDTTAALEALSRVRADYPSSDVAAPALYQEAIALRDLGQQREAERRFGEYLAATGPEGSDPALRQAAHLELARFSARSGDSRAVLERIARLTAEIPGSDALAEVHTLGAEAHFDLGSLDAARTSYQAALSRTREPVERQRLAYNIAICSAGLGDTAGSAASLAVAERGPDPTIAERSRYRLAVVQAQREPEVAIALLERITSTGTADEEALRLLGELKEGGAEPGKAAPVWSELVRRFPASPDWPRYLYRLGEAALAQGDAVLALDSYQRLIRAADGRPDLAALAAQARYGVGYVYSSRGEYVRSVPYFRDAASGTSDPGLGTRSLYAQAVASYNTGDYDAASRVFQGYIQAVPDPVSKGRGNLGLGKSELRAGRLEAAQRAFLAAGAVLRATDDGAECLYWLAVTHTRLGRAAAATQAYLDLARDYPESPHAPEGWLRAGVLARIGGDPKSSQVYLDHALDSLATGGTSGIREEALYESALTLLEMDRLADARRRVSQLEREYPASLLAPESLLRVAQADLRAGRYRQAAGAFQDLARDYPASDAAGPALFLAAESWAGAQDVERAISGYWDYVKRYPAGSYVAASEAGIVKALGANPGRAVLEGLYDRAGTDTGVPPSVVNRVRLVWATYLETRGDNDRALGVARTIVPEELSEPNRGEAVLLGARLDRVSGDPDRAAAVFAALAASRSDRVAALALLELAGCLAELGRAQEAVAEFLRAAEQYREHPDLVPRALAGAWRVLGEVGDVEGAARIADRLAREFPDYSP